MLCFAREAAGNATQMAAKWGDAIIETMTFDELPRRLGDGAAVHDVLTHVARRRHFQGLLLRRASLMHALALQYLRRDDCLEHLVLSGAKTREPFRTRGGTSTDEPAASRDHPAWKELEVLGGVTDSERRALDTSPDRVGFLFTQILDQINNRRADGGLGVDAPVLSRVQQQISDGMLGFRQARKIEDVPFPFLYTQAITVFLGIFVVIFPLILGRFANGARAQPTLRAPWQRPRAGCCGAEVRAPPCRRESDAVGRPVPGVHHGHGLHRDAQGLPLVGRPLRSSTKRPAVGGAAAGLQRPAAHLLGRAAQADRRGGPSRDPNPCVASMHRRCHDCRLQATSLDLSARERWGDHFAEAETAESRGLTEALVREWGESGEVGCARGGSLFASRSVFESGQRGHKRRPPRASNRNDIEESGRKIELLPPRLEASGQ